MDTSIDLTAFDLKYACNIHDIMDCSLCVMSAEELEEHFKENENVLSGNLLNFDEINDYINDSNLDVSDNLIVKFFNNETTLNDLERSSPASTHKTFENLDISSFGASSNHNERNTPKIFENLTDSYNKILYQNENQNENQNLPSTINMEDLNDFREPQLYQMKFEPSINNCESKNAKCYSPVSEADFDENINYSNKPRVNLLEVLEEKSSSFQRISTIPDGNCLFRAVSFYFFKNQNFYRQFREEAVYYIYQNWGEVSSFRENENVDKENYCKTMIQNGCFGTSLECFALSEIYKINFKIYCLNSNPNLERISFSNEANIIFGKKEFTKSLYLLFWGNPNSGHFDFLLKDESVPTHTAKAGVPAANLRECPSKQPFETVGLSASSKFTPKPITSPPKLSTSSKFTKECVITTPPELSTSKFTPEERVITPPPQIHKRIFSKADSLPYKDELNKFLHSKQKTNFKPKDVRRGCGFIKSLVHNYFSLGNLFSKFDKNTLVEDALQRQGNLLKNCANIFLSPCFGSSDS